LGDPFSRAEDAANPRNRKVWGGFAIEILVNGCCYWLVIFMDKKKK
jgi:hypothetical protein